MDAPEELVDAVVAAICGGATLGADAGPYYRSIARAVLAVPAIADALARDAQVRSYGVREVAAPDATVADRLRAHAHLHPESADLCREAADMIDRLVDVVAWQVAVIGELSAKP